MSIGCLLVSHESDSGRLKPWQRCASITIGIAVLLCGWHTPPFQAPQGNLPSTTYLAPQIRANLTLAEDIFFLSKHGRTSRTGVTRPYLSDASAQARVHLLSRFRAARLRAWVDGAGNVWGRSTCGNKRVLIVGSHFDSVINGGVWDGAYGVLAGLHAVSQVLNGSVCKLPFDIAVLAIDDEEGSSPFGSVSTGAKALAGSWDVERDVRDPQSFAKAYVRNFGGTEDVRTVAHRIQSAKLEAENIVAFIEAHIEQGPVLEESGQALGAVTAVAGQTRLRLVLTGQAGHAGTVPMGKRRDALAAAAEVVLAVERVAGNAAGSSRGSGSAVATVGTLKSSPGATNVISGEASLSIDVRSGDDGERRRIVHQIRNDVSEIARKRCIKVGFETVHETNATRLSPWVNSAIADAVESSEGNHGMINMVSGAGHDAQTLAELVDTGIMFLRCRGGVSHSPAEHVDEQDAHLGVNALVKVIESIAHRE